MELIFMVKHSIGRSCILHFPMHSKLEIIEGFRSKWMEISAIVYATDAASFTHKTEPEVWSIAEEFDHVIKSASAVSSAMKISPLILKWKFGNFQTHKK